MTGPTGDDLLRLYLEKRPNLVRFIAARTGSMATAEDVVQELYVKLRGLGEVDAVTNPTAFLYKMAGNLMLDSARSSRRGALRDNAWREASGVSGSGEDRALLPPADEVVASRQRLRQLVSAVDDLPPQMGRAFRLHKLQGLSHAQTAQAMGISVKVVEKHISAALKRLTGRIGR
jgi:RNA polymerase sigma factor (sigma-70 family)